MKNEEKKELLATSQDFYYGNNWDKMDKDFDKNHNKNNSKEKRIKEKRKKNKK